MSNHTLPLLNKQLITMFPAVPGAAASSTPPPSLSDVGEVVCRHYVTNADLPPGSSLRTGAKTWVGTANFRKPEWKTLIAKFCLRIKHLEGVSLATYGVEHVSGCTPGQMPPVGTTPHVQFCVTFKTTQRFNAVRNCFPGAWIAKAFSANAAHNYCKKENDWKVIDNRKRQGAREDIEVLRRCLNERMSLALLYERHPAIAFKHYRGYIAGLAAMAPRRQHLTRILWIHGPPLALASPILFKLICLN